MADRSPYDRMKANILENCEEDEIIAFKVIAKAAYDKITVAREATVAQIKAGEKILKDGRPNTVARIWTAMFDKADVLQPPGD